MEELLGNANEFLESGRENFIKGRYNVRISDYFKSIVIFCDYLIYQEIKRVPKNHSDRFALLRLYFGGIYDKVSPLFGRYIKSYNLKMDKMDCIKLEEYANELKRIAENKD